MTTHAIPGRLRAVAVLVAGLCAGFALAAVPSSASGALEPVTHSVAKQSSGYTNVFSTRKITSSKHKALHLSISGATADHGIDVSLRKGSEYHAWSFAGGARNVAIKSTGAGVLKTPAIKGFGVLNLKVVPGKSWKSHSCNGTVIWKSRPVTLKGAFVFDTATAWGKVGAKKKFAIKGTVTHNTGADSSSCVPTTSDCTFTGGNWFAAQGTTTLTGYWDGDKGTLTGFRTVTLSKKVVRHDGITVPVPNPAITVAGTDDAPSGTVEVRSKGIVKGSATLSSTNGFVYADTCDDGNTVKHWYFTGTFTNGATKLAVKMAVFGKLSINNGAEASFSRTAVVA